MSKRFHGRWFKGAGHADRAFKRQEAEARQAATRPERTKKYRLTVLPGILKGKR